MTLSVESRNQMLGVYSGWLFLACFGVGLALVAPLVPPPAPSLSAEAIQAYFAEHAWRVIAGCFIAMMGAGFQVPCYVALACQMARMERGMPFLAISQLAIGAYNCVFFILGPVLWVAIAFRPQMQPEIARAFHDFGWIIYLFIISPAIVANIAIAICTLQDQLNNALLPRWFGYLSIWVAVLFLPAGFMPYFKDGPFAWNGIIVFWVVIAAFFIWFMSLQYCLVKAIKKRDA